MATKRKTESVNTPIGIHELELALIREKAAWQDWNLRVAGAELSLMKRICRKTQWATDYEPLAETLRGAVNRAARAVKDKDTTSISAAHSKLERAIYDLRDKLYR